MKFEVFVARIRRLLLRNSIEVASCRLQVVSLHMSAIFHSLTAVLRQEAAYLALGHAISQVVERRLSQFTK